MIQSRIPFAICCLAVATCVAAAPKPHSPLARRPEWLAHLARELPILGHRNWIVISDLAYPKQVSPGIETIYTDDTQLNVLKKVLALLRHAKHVTPDVFLDSELAHLNNSLAPGIVNYRSKLLHALGKRMIQTDLHANMISRLNTAGKTFRVVLLKTNLTLPYTTVFLRLNCAYWSDANEAKLRRLMKKGG